MIVAVVLLARKFSIDSLSLGILVASFTQLLTQLPGLKGTRIRIVFDWRNPVVRRILRLYAPVILSVLITNIASLSIATWLPTPSTNHHLDEQGHFSHPASFRIGIYGYRLAVYPACRRSMPR